MTSITTPDTDLIILQQITDDELEELCYSNRYFHNLCQNHALWRHKILTLYPDFPLKGYLLPEEWKKLYYKLKAGDWTAIVVWADYHHNVDVLQWMMTLPEYRQYLIQNIKNEYLKRIAQLKYKRQKQKVTIDLFNFIYNHRYAMKRHLFSPNMVNTIINKLDELILLEPELKDIYQSYKQSIFNPNEV